MPRTFIDLGAYRLSHGHGNRTILAVWRKLDGKAAVLQLQFASPTVARRYLAEQAMGVS